jgi:hypothetical protein
MQAPEPRANHDSEKQSSTTEPVQNADIEIQRLASLSPTQYEQVWAIRAKCPAYVEVDRWQQAVKDARRFLATWGEQAEALGWTSRELLGLHAPPERPAASYQRLSRYDATGLVWLLQGRPVVALTAKTAVIQPASGGIVIYRKYNKPALGPVGDSLDDFDGAA